MCCDNSGLSHGNRFVWLKTNSASSPSSGFVWENPKVAELNLKIHHDCREKEPEQLLSSPTSSFNFWCHCYQSSFFPPECRIKCTWLLPYGPNFWQKGWNVLLLNSNFKIQNASFTKRIPSTAQVRTGSITLAEPKIQNHQSKSLNVDFCFFCLFPFLNRDSVAFHSVSV